MSIGRSATGVEAVTRRIAGGDGLLGKDGVMVRRIGLWVSEERPDLPDPRALVDSGWDADEREDVASYLSFGTVAPRHPTGGRCQAASCMRCPQAVCSS